MLAVRPARQARPDFIRLFEGPPRTPGVAAASGAVAGREVAMVAVCLLDRPADDGGMIGS